MWTVPNYQLPDYNILHPTLHPTASYMPILNTGNIFNKLQKTSNSNYNHATWCCFQGNTCNENNIVTKRAVDIW